MVGFLPPVQCFQPGDAPASGVEVVNLSLDEWEAVRLKDYLGLEQEECAGLMGVAQSSLQRILATARLKLASAVVEGKAITIRGGAYHIVGRGFCHECRREWPFPADPGSQTHRRCPSCGAGNIGRRGPGRGGPPWRG
jgi:predicted DNA-binding protein (UPF0251 family)